MAPPHAPAALRSRSTVAACALLALAWVLARGLGEPLLFATAAAGGAGVVTTT